MDDMDNQEPSNHRHVRLDPRLKKAIRANIVDFMQHEHWRQHESEPVAMSIPLFSLHKVAFLTSLFLVCGVGIASASESSLPGDLLYPMKLHVYEPLLISVHLSEEAKVDREAEMVAKRMQELKRLSAVQRLSEDRYELVRSRLQYHTEMLQEHLDEIAQVHGEERANELKQRVQHHLANHANRLNHLAYASAFTK